MNFFDTSASVTTCVSMASITDEERSHEFAMFKKTLNVEQVKFQQHVTLVRTWAFAAHEDFIQYSSRRLASIDAVVSQHMHSHFPIIRLHNAVAAQQAVGLCVGTYANKLGVPENEVYTVMMANLSYFGRRADVVILETVNLVAKLIATSPSRSCAVFIYPNARSPTSAATNAAVVLPAKCFG